MKRTKTKETSRWVARNHHVRLMRRGPWSGAARARPPRAHRKILRRNQAKISGRDVQFK